MNQNSIVFISAISLYALILLSLPFRRIWILRRAGKKIFAVQKKSALLSIFVIIFGAVLISILSIRDLGLMGNIVIALVALLGCAMSSQEASLNSSAGVYENGLINGGIFLSLKEIYAIPLLSLEKEEQKTNESSILKIITDKKGTVTFYFSSIEECNAVIEKICELKPGLKS